MLKTQLRSKIGALGRNWHEVEDLLTGDYFGVLDYLPRCPFLVEFFRLLADNNMSSLHPDLEEVDWESVQFLFWPMLKGFDEAAEPDVVVISNRWVVVIEVKLESGLGANQPWREYCVGREIAREHGIPDNCVYYLIVARSQLSVADTFDENLTADQQKELLGRTSYLLWHQACALIERWLRNGVAGQSIHPESRRMLKDLHDALRRRRSISFSGFSFVNQDDVPLAVRAFFCPDRFAGFLNWVGGIAAPEAKIFISTFQGSLETPCKADDPGGNSTYSTYGFTGFLSDALDCQAGSTLQIQAQEDQRRIHEVD